MFGLSKPLTYALAVLALVAFLLGAVSCIRSDAARDERARQEAQIERDKAAQRARETVAEQRRRDAEAEARDQADQRKQEIDNATAGIVDQAPSARQRSRACIELRRQHAASGSRDPSPC
jgi:hypothetical protein